MRCSSKCFYNMAQITNWNKTQEIQFGSNHKCNSSDKRRYKRVWIKCDAYYKSAVDFLQDLFLIERHGLSFPFLYSLFLQFLTSVHFPRGPYLTRTHLQRRNEEKVDNSYFHVLYTYKKLQPQNKQYTLLIKTSPSCDFSFLTPNKTVIVNDVTLWSHKVTQDGTWGC